LQIPCILRDDSDRLWPEFLLFPLCLVFSEHYILNHPPLLCAQSLGNKGDASLVLLAFIRVSIRLYCRHWYKVHNAASSGCDVTVMLESNNEKYIRMFVANYIWNVIYACIKHISDNKDSMRRERGRYSGEF
jgi:hypothetical protein